MRLGLAVAKVFNREDIDDEDVRAAMLAVDFFRWILLTKLIDLTDDVLDGEGGKKLFALAARKWINVVKRAKEFELEGVAPPEVQDAWNEYMQDMEDNSAAHSKLRDIMQQLFDGGNPCDICPKSDGCLNKGSCGKEGDDDSAQGDDI